MNDDDILPVAEIHKLAFPRQTFAKEWIECTYRAFPMSQCFVADLEGKPIGFIIWTEKGGFQKEALLDLEQGGVDPKHQGKGVCTALILESLPLIAKKIAERGAKIKNIIVNTRADNDYALRICKNTLGAEPTAVISGVFTADEIYLVAGDIEKLIEQGKIAGRDQSELT